MTGNGPTDIVIQSINGKGEKEESGLLTLWNVCRWQGPVAVSMDNVGLVFPPTKASIDRVEAEPGRVKIFVALQGDVVVGACILHLAEAIGEYATQVVDFLGELGSPQPAFVRSLCVSPTVRRQGVGQRLLTHAKLAAAEYGATAVAGNVLLQPHVNHRLVTAYKNAGFVDTQEKLHYSRHIRRDMTWVWDGREEFLPEEIQLTYGCMVAPVAGFVLRKSEGGSGFSLVRKEESPIVVS